MARLGGIDRGLLSRVTAQGKRRWYVRLSIDGRMRQFGTFTSKEKARAFYETTRSRRREQDLFPGRTISTPLTVKQLTAEFLPMVAHQRDARGQRRYAAWWIAYAGSRPVFTLTLADLERARVTLRADKAANTVTHYMQFLKAAMRRCIQPRSWVVDLWAGFRFDPPDTHPIQTVSPAAEAALLRALGPREAPKARLAALTGLRRGQLFGLRWEWVQWKDRALSLPAFKRRPARAIPLAREAVQLLRDQWQTSRRPADGWIFPDPERPALPQDANGWYKYVFKRAVQAAGLTAQGITFHTLRHTWASRMITVGTHPRVLQQAGGWSSLSLVERYTHPHDQTTRASLEAVARITNRRKLQTPGRPQGRASRKPLTNKRKLA